MSASQLHGTVIITVLIGFVILAVLARIALTGLGPFPVTLTSAVPAGATPWPSR